MHVRLKVLGSLTLTILVVFAFVTKTNAVTDLMPNLQPQPARHLNVQQIGRKTYLRFSTTSWNNGAGPLEIQGGDTDRQTKRQKVYQRVYASDGSHRDVFAGWFTWHKAHGHIHFDDYAIYTLEPVSAPDASGRQSTKTTFCIMDTDLIDPSLPGAPASPAYNACSTQTQGMSVGWGDTYGYQLSGQSIDITNLSEGEYFLKIEIDPSGKILEANETDNISMLRLRIAGSTVTIVQ